MHTMRITGNTKLTKSVRRYPQCANKSAQQTMASSSAKCQTSSSSTTLPSTLSTQMEYQDPQCMNFSQEFSKDMVSSDTNNRAGAPTTLPDPSSSTSPSHYLRSRSKQDLESGYSGISTTNNASISSPSDEEGDDRPLYTLENTQFTMTDKHQIVLDVFEESTGWYKRLTTILTEAECCECFSRAALYKHRDVFPETAVNEKLYPHALRGWELLRAANGMYADYPKETEDLLKRARAEGKPIGEF